MKSLNHESAESGEWHLSKNQWFLVPNSVSTLIGLQFSSPHCLRWTPISATLTSPSEGNINGKLREQKWKVKGAEMES